MDLEPYDPCANYEPTKTQDDYDPYDPYDGDPDYFLTDDDWDELQRVDYDYDLVPPSVYCHVTDKMLRFICGAHHVDLDEIC